MLEWAIVRNSLIDIFLEIHDICINLTTIPLNSCMPIGSKVDKIVHFTRYPE